LLNCLKVILLFVFIAIGQIADGQPLGTNKKDAIKEPLNQADAAGKRTGLWLIRHEEHMGDAPYFEFGHYDIGRKTGPWYKVDEEESLLAMENFRNDVLNGEVQYYNHGILVCIGHYRGLNNTNLFDTIPVIDPVTDTFVQRVIPADHGTLRHGVWKYYDENTGKLIKEEEYQVDSLIYRKEYVIKSGDAKEYEKNLPHNKKVKYRPPAGKEYSYLKRD
jgi:hypothetical protein